VSIGEGSWIAHPWSVQRWKKVRGLSRSDAAQDLVEMVLVPPSSSPHAVGRHHNVPEALVFDDNCASELAHPTAGHHTRRESDRDLDPGVPANHQLVPLTASTHAANLTWFVDGALVRTAPSDERVYWRPAAGKHEIVVADDAGHKAHRKLTVELGASQHPR